MKHKTLRTLLCVILTVCFCLSAIAPVSAAGLFGGDTGAASIFDEWIRSLKDRFMEKNPGTDETPAENETAAGEEFIRIFHLDCGRRYFSIAEIKGIIDTLEAKKYTHIELAFGNDGLRFLLDDMSVTANGTEYSNADVTAAIQAGNREYYSNGQNELSEADMNTIIAYANEHHISVIPLINMPGHSNALITAMAQLFGVNRNSLYTYENSNGGQAFKVVDNEKAVAFATALAKKYVDYFAAKGSEYFNIGADECGYTESASDNYKFEQTIASDLLIPMAEYIIGNGMKPMMFNDGFNTNDALQNALTANTYGNQFTICYWDYSKRTTADDLNKAGFGIINTHNKWYYVAGNEGENSDDSNWFGYGWAKNNLNGEYKNCSVCDSDFTQPNGCMLAYWCDKPTDAKDPKLDRVKELIGILSDNNTEKFTGNLSMPAKPAISGVPSSVQISDGTLNVSSSIAARWTSSNNSVITFADTATKAAADSASYTETATARIVGAGTAIITATTANRGWSVQTVTVTNNGGTVDPGTEYDNRNVTVTAGGTTTDTIIGTNYASGSWSTEDSNIATISVTGKDYEDGVINYTAESVSYGTLAGSNIGTYGKTDYYHKVGDNYYPVYAYRSNNNYVKYYYGYSITNGSSVENLGSSWSNWVTVTVYSQTTTPASPASTTITFTGAVGAASKTTYAIVGHVRYTINVTAADLSGVTPLPIQTWITNNAIEMEAGTYTTASKYSTESYYPDWANPGISNYQYAKYVEVAANDTLNTQYGMHIEDLMPNGIFGYEYANTYWKSEHVGKTSPKQKLVVWSGRLHTAANNNVQTIAGTDYSNSGTEFYYVRYYDGKWAVSADRTYWVDVKGTNTQSTEQIVVYYMIRSEITQEVTTDVADWAKPKGTENYTTQISEDFVLLDFAVKYEDGTQFPETFPVDGKTMAYHCASGEAIGGSGATKYRKLNNFRAVDTSDYEVYMVTVTMTNDQANETLTATSAQTVGGYTYDGKEQVLWAIDQKTRDAASILNDYTSISGSSTYSGCTIGGDPYIRGVEVYNKHGALITYYVRAKANPDSLTVNYYIDGLEEPFYFYNINVDANNPKGKFKTTIDLGNPWKGKLKDGDVENIKGKTQWVSADLSTMPEIGAQYRYSKYTCTRVERVSDKVVNLYYTFDNTASFVIDFGLPITIPYTAINSELENPTINDVAFTSPKYGTVTEGADYAIIYTPTKTVDKIDNFQVTYTGTRVAREGETQGAVTYQVYIIPASNVYYEETFIENNGWSKVTGGTENQALEKPGAKQNVYGYDPKVADKNTNIDHSMGGVYHTTLSLTDLSDTSYMFSNPLTFTFEGTGLDLISACNTNTGMLYVEVIGEKNGGAYRALVDTYFRGDDTNIIGNGATVYQVPVVRKLDLPYDMYTVTIKGYLYNGAGAVVKASTNAVAEVNSFNSYMVEEDALSTLVNALAIPGLAEEDIDVIYMDENSILNPNAAVAAADSSMAAYALDVASNASATAEVYVDGFRVYNPLGSSRTVVYEEKDANGEVVASHESYISLTDNDAYKKDNEAGVVYYPVYDFIKNSAADLSDLDDVIGVYIEYDGKTGVSAIADYKNQGPQHEVYLAPHCSIAFGINNFETGNVLQLSARAVSGNPAMTDTQGNDISINATEMYYSITYDTTNNNMPYVLITNVGADVLAISGIKVSSNIKPYMDGELAKAIIEKLNPPAGGQSFTPVTFEVKTPKSNPKANRNFVVNVKASAYRGEAYDVTKVTLSAVKKGTNEVAVALHDLVASNTRAVANKVSKNWNFNELCKLAAGTYTFTITAYNDAGETAVYTVDVTVVS